MTQYGTVPMRAEQGLQQPVHFVSPGSHEPPKWLWQGLAGVHRGNCGVHQEAGSEALVDLARS